MLRLMVSIGLAATALSTTMPAQAQYYREYREPRYYDDRPPPPPRRYYREREYYGPYDGPPPRAYRRDGGGDFLTPRRDPRNGGLYCLDHSYTVQDGVCKPGR